MKFAWPMYRWFARAFPHEFKMAYGHEMTQLGEEVVDEIARQHGAFGLISLVADIAYRVPLEYLDEMRRDLRYALRAMIKSPGFALVAIISTGIAMGLTTMIYNSKWQVITRELPSAANASRLVMAEKAVSYYYVEQYREQKDLFSGVAAIQTGVPFNVTFQDDVRGKPQRVFGQIVSTDYFSVLGVAPQRGRTFSSQLDKPGDAPVVVISDRFWRNRLNSSPDAVGQTLRVNGQPATIVGITPRNFNGIMAIDPSEIFVPVTAPAALAPELANDVLHQRNAREFIGLFCLAPRVTLETAESGLDALTRHLDQQDSSLMSQADKSRRVTLFLAGTMVPLPRNLKPVVMGFLLVLMGLIMTIACMNLTNMLLARAANRRRELAIRLSVGASRFRLVRQMMTEGVLLSLLGGIAGFALAYWLSAMQSRFVPPTAVPTETSLRPEWHAAIFAFLLAIICGVGLSLVPALKATKADLTPAIKEGSMLQLPGYRLFGVRNLLMVAQVTGSLMLLLITGFLVFGFGKANRIEARFDPHTMYLLSLDPVRDGNSPEKSTAFFQKLPERLKAAGPIESVALAAQVPFSNADEDETTQWTAEESHVQMPALEEIVGAGYFGALSEPLLAGREFTELDQRSPADSSKILPAVISESAAQGFFGNKNAVGQRIRNDKQSYEVIGVVHDSRNGLGLSLSVIYSPLTERNFSRPPADGITVMVRTAAGADSLAGIRRELASLDPKLNVFNVRTLNGFLELSRASQQFSIDTYGAIGVFGLVLAAIGLAGVTAYAVAQRRKEIGIRMALGARKGQVMALVLREGTLLVCAGSLLGFLGAFVVSKMLSALTSMFFDALKIGTNDPRLLFGAPLLLAGLALLACYVPARRAAKIDPLKALREG